MRGVAIHAFHVMAAACAMGAAQAAHMGNIQMRKTSSQGMKFQACIILEALLPLLMTSREDWIFAY
jgi:hypothetical protein